MDFSFSEEQRLVAEAMRAFARDVLLPKYAHWDRTGEFPQEQFRRVGQPVLVGVGVREVCVG